MNTVVYNSVADVVIVSDIVFDKSLNQEYLKLYKSRQEDGYINPSSSFDDESWLITINGVEQTMNFPKELVMKRIGKNLGVSLSDARLAYRSFMLYNMPNNVKTNDINRMLIKFFNGFNECGNMSIYLLYFLKFINVDSSIYSYYEEIVDDMIENKKVYSSRTLPKFEDIFLFSDIINHIIENNLMSKYQSYLLTIMWWKIVSVIPLRPSEFLRVKFDCIYKDKGSYYFQVKRAIKGHGNNARNTSKIEECYTEDLIEIDENTYDLISIYKDILTSKLLYKDNVDLFPKEMLINSGYYRNIDISAKTKKLNKDIILANELNQNIIRFYEDVIESDYNLRSKSRLKNTKEESDNALKRDSEYDLGAHCLERLKPYDARHIAIMNLVLMGNDPLTVMKLAGHEDINTTFGYYDHVESFAEGYAMSYSKKTKFKDEYDKISASVMTSSRKKRITFDDVMSEISGVNIEPVRVKGGYCNYPKLKTDKSLCLFYEGEHELCKYFKSDNKSVLELKLEDKKAQLVSDVKVMVDLAKDMNKVSKFNELYRATGYKVQEAMNDIKNINLKLERCD